MSYARVTIRLAMTVANRIRGLIPASLRRPGVIGIAFTPAGRIILVQHSYVRGWYPPGGGRKHGEGAAAAVIRELSEEIGLERWSSLKPVTGQDDDGGVFVLRDAIYHPRPSLEIQTVAEFDIGDLPADASPRLRRILAKQHLDPDLGPAESSKAAPGPRPNMT